MAGPWEKYARSAPAQPGMPVTIPLPRSPSQQAADSRAAAEAARQAAAAERERIKFNQDQADHNAKSNADGTPKMPAPIGDVTKTGADYLATLPANVRSRVQQLLDGRSMLTAREKGMPFGQQLMDAANQADPNFDENVSKARYNARQQFTGMGKGTQLVQAAERLAQHVNDLYTASSNLPGPDLGFSPISNMATRGAQMFHQKDVASYNTILPLIAGELQKLTKNGASTVDESKHIMANLDPGQPKDVRNAAIQEIVRLGEAQMQPQREAWASAWQGSTPPPMPMDFSPATQAIFDNINQGGKPLKIDHATGAVVGAGTGPTGSSGNGGSHSNGGPIIGGDFGGAGGGSQLAAGGDTEKSIAIPDAMQAANLAYFQAHRGHMDPNDYAQFRAGMDKQYGFPVTPEKLQEYRAFATAANQPGAHVDTHIPPVNQEMTGQEKFNASIFNDKLTGGMIGAAVMGAGGLGGGMDELAGTVRGLATGTPISTNIDNINAMRQAAASAHPYANFAGTLGGTIAGGFGLGGAFPALGSMAAEYPIAASAAYGAANGALENNDNRIAGLLTGGATGAAGGAAGKYVLAPITEKLGRNRVIDALLGPSDSRPLLSKAESATLGIKPDLATAQKNLSDAGDLGLPYAPADADPQLRILAGVVSRKSPEARALAETTFDPRGRGQADRAVNAIDTNLAPITNIGERGTQLLQAGDQAAAPYYNTAMARPGPIDPQIDAMLTTPAGQKALSNARTIAANEGRDPNAMGFDLDDQGNVTLKYVPSFDTLQLAKRGLDSHLDDFRDQFGNLNLRGNPMAQAVNDLRGRFVSRLGEINPDYAEGNQIWSRYAGQKDALNLGHDVLPQGNVPMHDFQAGVGNLTADQLPEAQRGYATAMADKANSVRLSSNPYEAIYGSPDQQAKVGTLFPDGTAAFDRTYGLESDMAKTRYEALGGSPTAARQGMDDALSGPLGSMALDGVSQIATGGGLNLGTALAVGRRALGDAAKLGIGQRGRDNATRIAQILFDTSDPKAAAAAIADLSAKQAAIDARQQAHQRISALLGGATAAASFGP